MGFVFFDVLRGKTSPTWDFMTGYLVTDFAWWSEGGFFNPVEFIPYAHSGLPGYLVGSSTSWYIPMGIIFFFDLFSVKSLAILQVITIYFGVVGIYFLSRTWKISKWTSTIIAVGFLFTSGFFSSASHPDVLRGWAFMPWILYLLTPTTRFNLFRFLFGVLVFFQFFVGVYPGILIASVYILPIYMVTSFIILKSNFVQYLYLNIFPASLGTLMSLLEWLPIFFERRVVRAGNTVTPSVEMLFTLVYPLRSMNKINEITQTSIFIVSFFLFSLLLFKKFEKKIVVFLSILILSAMLGFEIFLSTSMIDALPLLAESSRRTTDFKLFLTIALLVLSGIALDQVFKSHLSAGRFVFILISIIGFYGGLNYFVKQRDINMMDLYIGNLYGKYAIVSLLIIFGVIFITTNYFRTYIFPLVPILILIFTGFLGSLWALSNEETWSAGSSETLYYDQPVENLLNYGAQVNNSWREARIGPDFPVAFPIDYTNHLLASRVLTREFSHGGYIGFLGAERLEWLKEKAMQDSAAPYFYLLGERLSGYVTTEEQIGLNSINCVNDLTCLIKDAEVKEKSWTAEKFVFDVYSPQAANFFVNEVPWNGWWAEVCNLGTCTTHKINHDLEYVFISTEIPAGTSQVTFYFDTPFLIIAWGIFWTALFIALLAVFVLSMRSNKEMS